MSTTFKPNEKSYNRYISIPRSTDLSIYLICNIRCDITRLSGIQFLRIELADQFGQIITKELKILIIDLLIAIKRRFLIYMYYIKKTNKVQRSAMGLHTYVYIYM